MFSVVEKTLGLYLGSFSTAKHEALRAEFVLENSL